MAALMQLSLRKLSLFSPSGLLMLLHDVGSGGLLHVVFGGESRVGIVVWLGVARYYPCVVWLFGAESIAIVAQLRASPQRFRASLREAATSAAQGFFVAEDFAKERDGLPDTGSCGGRIVTISGSQIPSLRSNTKEFATLQQGCREVEVMSSCRWTVGFFKLLGS